MRFELDIEPMGASVVGRLCSHGSSWRTFAGRIELLAALDAAFEAALDDPSEPTGTGDPTP